MKKAYLMIAVGSVWMVAVALICLRTATAVFSGFGITVPRWMPVSLGVGIVMLTSLIVCMGWMLPLSLGIRTLLKHRQTGHS